MPLYPGLILRQRYQIQAVLGQGGYGAVYRALDLNLQLFGGYWGASRRRQSFAGPLTYWRAIGDGLLCGALVSLLVFAGSLCLGTGLLMFTSPSTSTPSQLVAAEFVFIGVMVLGVVLTA